MTSIPLMDVNNYLTITTHWDFMTSFLLKTLYFTLYAVKTKTLL
jgi:hypothetical protein